jgi:cell division protein ZapA (FtsZ GTPase activity inhibitor)
MIGNNDIEVVIGGKVITLSGSESEEYIQKVASYINNKISEYNNVDSFRRQSADMQNILLLLNIADDYFKRILDKIYSMKWETGSSEISGEEMMSLLTSTPGVGNQTAVLWLSRVITPRRFKNEKALAAYCGLDPSLKVSAGKVTSTVKRGGRKDLHSAFCMSASNLMRRHTEPFGKFGYNIAIQNGIWKKGVSALARKLATSMYYVSLRGEPFSYEKYKMINEPDVLNVSVETLVLLEPSFKRYLRFLYQNDIKDTKTLVHKYFICELPSIKGLGKNFFALVKDFINNQKKYNELYERMVSNEDNT